MSLSTSFILGTYLVCKMKKETGEDLVLACERNPKHDVDMEDNFCAKCGGMIVHTPTTYDAYVSFTDVIDEIAEDDMSKEIRQIYKSFWHIPGEFVGFDEEGYEIISTSNSLYLSGDNEGVHDISLDQLAKLQLPPTNIDLLQRVIGYESVEVKFGVLVQVA